jgi:hypothetical protein
VEEWTMWVNVSLRMNPSAFIDGAQLTINFTSKLSQWFILEEDKGILSLSHRPFSFFHSFIEDVLGNVEYHPHQRSRTVEI